MHNHFHNQHHHYRGADFCLRCGHPLSSATLKQGEPERLYCPECGYVHYFDPKLAACGLIVIRDRVLLCQRSIEPAKGLWVLPGGFVDRGERVEQAMEREVLEETGLKVRAAGLVGLYSYPGETVAVAVYLGEVLDGRPEAKDETQEVGLYAPGEIPWDRLAFSSTRDALQDFVRGLEDA